MGLRVVSLGSGSCGNALVVSTEATTLLVDCGVGRAEIELGLGAIDRTLRDVQAVLVSHEHHDHIRGLSRLGRAIPVLCTRGTGRATRTLRGQWEEIHPRTLRHIGDLEVMTLPVSHDAAEPCGYSLSDGSHRVTILTDLGCWSDSLAAPVADSNLIVVEANYDEGMLDSGPYSQRLKDRVASKLGHLSNRQCGEALATTLSPFAIGPTVWLAHLSQTNNRPEIAQAAVAATIPGRNVEVLALPRRALGPVWSSSAPIAKHAQLRIAFAG